MNDSPVANHHSVSIGNYNVYASGTIVGLLNQTIKVKIDTLEYHFTFVSDTNDPKARVDSKIDDTKRKRFITLTNFNSRTGNGISQPWNVGRLKPDVLLYLVFVAYNYDPTAGSVLHYTFLTAENS